MCCCWKNVENLIVFRHFYKILKGQPESVARENFGKLSKKSFFSLNFSINKLLGNIFAKILSNTFKSSVVE
jgi:hypothetical protein